MSYFENKQNNVLLIEDDAALLQMVFTWLVAEGFEVDMASDGESALRKVRLKEYDVVLADLNLPGISGMDVIQQLKSLYPDTEVIVHTGHSTVDTAIDAVRNRAFDYLIKPTEMRTLVRSVHHAAERRFLILQNRELIKRLENERNGLRDEVMASKQAIERHLAVSSDFIGDSDPIQQVRHLIAEVGPSDLSVLVRGESGTGKDVVARLIHEWSGRSEKGNFVKINCPAISENLMESEMFGHERGAFTGAVKKKPGRFEFASGGSIFLDEIGAIPPFVQAKLLQVIEHKQFVRVGGNQTLHVDARVISATNANLEEMIDQGRFRADLYYRLEQFTISIPPLRNRIDDIPLLAEYFFSEGCRKYGKNHNKIPSNIMAQLVEYHWPGNVRQLKAVMERFVLNNNIDLLEKDLNRTFPGKHKERTTGNLYSDNEIRTIIAALTETDWNRRKAAKILGISYSTLRRKIEKHNIKKVAYSPQQLPFN